MITKKIKIPYKLRNGRDVVRSQDEIGRTSAASGTSASSGIVGGSRVTSLSSLDDVYLSSEQDKDFLSYNSSTDRWENIPSNEFFFKYEDDESFENYKGGAIHEDLASSVSNYYIGYYDGDNWIKLKSGDSDQLGGHDADKYPRRDINETITGEWTFEEDVQVDVLKGSRWELRMEHPSYVFLRDENHLSTIKFYPDDGKITATGDLEIDGSAYFDSHLTSKDNFVGGFAGENWKLDADDNHLTLDRLTVRGRMDVYELMINQIR
ncbi:MAG: hypothetical protein ACOCSL_03155, partial [Thermoplasmatota archaeon]